jgi:hypothetical protein
MRFEFWTAECEAGVPDSRLRIAVGELAVLHVSRFTGSQGQEDDDVVHEIY